MCIRDSIHVTLIPYLKASGEMKTKPTQASVKELDVYKRQLLALAAFIDSAAASSSSLALWMASKDLNCLIRAFLLAGPIPVSYTHLDVYKRQVLECV